MAPIMASFSQCVDYMQVFAILDPSLKMPL
jgi:hypothetical protein